MRHHPEIKNNFAKKLSYKLNIHKPILLNNTTFFPINKE